MSSQVLSCLKNDHFVWRVMKRFKKIFRDIFLFFVGSSEIATKTLTNEVVAKATTSISELSRT